MNPGAKACRTLLIGPTGVGKTAVALKLGEIMAEEARKNKVNLRYLYLNCRILKDENEILFSILSALLPSFPRKGLGYVDLLRTLWQYLEQKNLQLMLTLDEAHYLAAKRVRDVIYDLSRIHEQFSGPRRLHLMLISRDERVLDALDVATSSMFKANVVRFSKYSASQLYDIVKARVEEAFHSNTVGHEVITMVADIAEPSGDARYAIELIWRAGKHADFEGLDQVSLEHVRMAKAEIHPEVKREALYALNLPQRLLLLAIARYFRKEERAYVSKEAIEGEYRLICEEFDVPPSNDIVEDLQNLYGQGLIVLKEGGGGLNGCTSLHA